MSSGVCRSTKTSSRSAAADVQPQRAPWKWRSTSADTQCRLTALQCSTLALSILLAALVPFLLFPRTLVLLRLLALLALLALLTRLTRLLLAAALLFLAVLALLALLLFLLILLPIFPSVVIAHSNLLG
jgi:hypothetical protein